MTSAWDGVREKSEALAGDAVQAVKDRPLAFSGVGAAVLLFLAREPIRRAFAGLWPTKEDDVQEDEDMITAHLADANDQYDLTAPTVERTRYKGANV
jgi:hypothetical protein